MTRINDFCGGFFNDYYSFDYLLVYCVYIIRHILKKKLDI